MIASFQHGFVFIKSKKTAGSTVEHVLAPRCGAQDVVTPAGFAEPVQAGGEARNFTADPEVMALYRTGLERGEDPGFERFLEIDARCREAGDFYAHMTAEEARARLGPEVWARSFKFSIERHPYEKAVSQAWFSWARAGEGEQDFDAFFDRVVRTGPYLNARFYCIDGRPALDRVIRYEKLDEELGEIASGLGLEIPRPLPRIKGGFRADPRLAREVLTQAQRQAIHERCRFEFDFMGYEP
jgi:hypothetical protein